MCLILFSWKQHADYQLVLAANRDEFYDRPTEAATFWEDKPAILGGRDLTGGGTWIGMTKRGRFAALTNYRDPKQIKAVAPTRGKLVSDYLEGQMAARDYLESLKPTAGAYNGFNLVVGDLQELLYFSNYEGSINVLEPGLYGLSNHLLNSNWPKVEKGKRLLQEHVACESFHPDTLFNLLDQKQTFPDEELPQTGVSLEWERALSAMHIETEKYGTVSATVILANQAHVLFAERVHPTIYRKASDKLFEFTAG